MGKAVIKKKEIPVIHIKQIINQLKQAFPDWVKSPTQIIILFMNLSNDLLIIFCWLLLLGQSARVLTAEQKYVNLKFLLVKWIVFLTLNSILSSIQRQNLEGVILKFIFLFITFIIIYPSKLSKTIFQRFIKPQQYEKQPSRLTDSMIKNNSFLYKFLISLMVFLLNVVKYVLTFIHPDNRKPIQQQIKGINMVLIQEKYFWKIYDPSAPVLTKQKINYMNESMDKSLKVSHDMSNFEQREVKKTYNNKNTLQLKDSSPLAKTVERNKYDTKKLKKHQVSEYLPLFSAKNRASVYPNSSTRRCTYYRQIQISYDIDSAQMTITSLQDMKISYHSLQQVILLQDLMVQFQFEGDQQAIVKFKSKKQLDQFISEIDMHESTMEK